MFKFDPKVSINAYMLHNFPFLAKFLLVYLSEILLKNREMLMMKMTIIIIITNTIIMAHK